MRNPIDRSWSGILHQMKMRNEKFTDFSESEIVVQLESQHNTRRSDYLSTIHNWTSIFPSDQLLLLYFDDIKTKPKRVIRKVLSFLNLNKLFTRKGNYKKKVNQGLDIKIPKRFRNFLHEIYDEKIDDLYRELKNPIIKTWKEK